MRTSILINDLEDTKAIVLNQLQSYKAKVYLFGSQAAGKARLYSDIDVAILPLQPLPAIIFSELREKLEESNVLRTVDVVNLVETDEQFQKRVEEEGVLWRE
ncbi:MAG: nucleotidyltransferase family protein [Anaerolineales bacterium]